MRFDISSERLALDHLFDQLYADNDLSSSPDFTPTSVSLDIEVVEDRSSVLCPPTDAVFAETNLCGGRCYYAEGAFVAVVDGSHPLQIEYDIRTARLHARVGGQFVTDPQATIGRIVRPILQSFLLPFHRLKSLHAAAVALDGRGTLLIGPGGAGKTTTAIELARNGFTLLSDDGLLVTTTAAGAVALASLDYVHATDRTVALFPALRPHIVGGRDHRGKYAIDRRAFPGDDDWRRPIPIRNYVELHRRHIPRPAITPLERLPVFADVVRESMVVFRSAAFRQPIFAEHSAWTLECLRAVVSGARAFRLDFDDHHLHQLPELIAGLGD